MTTALARTNAVRANKRIRLLLQLHMRHDVWRGPLWFAPNIMPKALPEDLSKQLFTHLSAHPDGLGIDAIDTAFGEISRRSLQRRLAALVDAGKVETEGSGKRTLYRALSEPKHGPETPPETYISVSPTGAEVRALIGRPMHQRTPVAYDRSLLERYEPNQSAYLDPELREHLQKIGQVHVKARPAGTYARSILDRLLIDLSWASSRLEGNTYSRLDTKDLIEFGRYAVGKDRTEAQMILNHKAAIEMLIDDIDSIGFNRYTFQNLHALLSDNLLADPSESGRVRSRLVDVAGTVYHPLNIPQELERLFDLFLEKADAIKNPFEQSFFVLVHVPYLQAFIDVNKRLSRLGANIPLIRENLVPLSFVDVPERAYVEGTLGVYELGRIELLRDVFTWAYERSCRRYAAIKQTVVEPDPLRLRFRQQLFELVADVVRSGSPPITSELKNAAIELKVPKQEIDQFLQMVMADLRGLHEGNVARYRLRLREYQSWKAVQESIIDS